MKKSITIGLLTSAFALAACYDTDSSMEVKEDGSVKFESEVIVYKTLWKAFQKATGEDILMQQCEESGGEFDEDVYHVNCKVKVDSSLDEIMAGNIQNERNSAPLDLSGLVIADNGDGTYALSYAFDWSLLNESEAVVTDAAVEDEMSDDEEAAEDAAEDAESGDVEQAEEDMSDQESKDEKDIQDAQERLSNYLDGYTVSIEFKAPSILETNGELNSSNDESKMEIDLGSDVLPETFDVVFSTSSN